MLARHRYPLRSEEDAGWRSPLCEPRPRSGKLGGGARGTARVWPGREGHVLPSLGGTPEERPRRTYHSPVPERDAPPVVIAPPSFQGSADAVAVASAIARGVRRVWPRAVCVELPLADGGEGTTLARVRATGGELRDARVHDPLGPQTEARWGVLGARMTAAPAVAAPRGLPRRP